MASAFGHDVLMKTLSQLDALIRRHCAPGAPRETALPRVTLHRYEQPPDPMDDMYHPLICFIVRGTKHGSVDDDALQYSDGDHVVNALDQPVKGLITGAPYSAASMELDLGVLAELVLDKPTRSPASSKAMNLCSAPANPPMLDALRRLLGLLDTPADIPALAPLIERELLYRVLHGPCGQTLRHATFDLGPTTRVRPAIEWIRTNLDQPLAVDALARSVDMSTTSLYRHFKLATTMTPLQFQKRLRLQEARRLLLTGQQTSDSVARLVGYQSASQFNREYRRQFGSPPARDTLRRS